ncbi:MAG: hypothetical protein ACLVHV_16545 [Oscillospiraceae bacterium]
MTRPSSRPWPPRVKYGQELLVAALVARLFAWCCCWACRFVVRGAFALFGMLPHHLEVADWSAWPGSSPWPA